MPSVTLLRRLLPAAAIAVASLLPAETGRGARMAATLLPSPQALIQILTETRRPPRDLYAITARLKLHTLDRVVARIRATSVDYAVGRIDRFYVAHGSNASGFTAQTAVLQLKTAHAYWYVQQGVPVSMVALRRSAAAFERSIYPTDRAAFGAERTPGVDDDARITVLNCRVPDAGIVGYFSAEDLYSRAVNAYSNQRKMIVMNAGIAQGQPGSGSYQAVLAHEFQHMIHTHLHPADELWLNEGSSMLAQVLNGYDASGRDGDFARDPSVQLDAWDPNNELPHYGAGYLWMLYLYEHYGGTRATHLELADNQLSNMALFDDMLPRLGAPITADDLFADWIVANFLNDRTIAGGRYGYSHTAIRLAPTRSVSLPFSVQRTTHQYGANYIEVGGVRGAAFTLRFAGAPTVALLETRAPAGGFWWSNRGDSTDDTLTAAVDLRGVRRATLRYALWYDLERDYDYGYVEVSDDGGRTWYAQSTAHTTRSNPNGANIGSGYTGSSCSAATRARGCWVDEAVDLSAHAGRRVLLRFEQVTDDGINMQGVAVAGVRVPEVGWSGDGAGGWQAAGWVRAGNALAERWLVRAIVYRPGGVAVLPLAVGADGAGSLRVPAGASRVVVAVAPAAPLTTVPAPYSLSGA